MLFLFKFYLVAQFTPPLVQPLLSFGIRAGLSELIPTNLESKDPVMDTDYSLPDVSIQPNKPPGFDGHKYPFWKF